MSVWASVSMSGWSRAEGFFAARRVLFVSAIFLNVRVVGGRIVVCVLFVSDDNGLKGDRLVAKKALVALRYNI